MNIQLTIIVALCIMNCRNKKMNIMTCFRSEKSNLFGDAQGFTLVKVTREQFFCPFFRWSCKKEFFLSPFLPGNNLCFQQHRNGRGSNKL